MENLPSNCEAFEWYEGNSQKNWHLHRVTDAECEEIFFNEPLLLARDDKHSQNETRYFVLGQTESGRMLFVAFALREKLIRIISAREMTRNEKRKYTQKFKTHTDLS